MSKLEKAFHGSYENLLGVDREGSIYDDYGRLTDLLSPRVIDKTTFYTIDVPDLFEAVNYTKTKTGATTLLRSLLQPLVSLDVILGKQNSLKELENNKEARKELKQYLNKLGKKEPYTHAYLFQCAYCQKEPHNLRLIGQYELYRRFREFFRSMVEDVKDLSCLESPYIKILLEDIKNVDGTRAYELIKGPVYKTLKGLRTKNEVGFVTPRIKFTLRSIKPTLAMLYAAIALPMAYEPVRLAATYVFLAYNVFFWWYPDRFDREHFIDPLREIYKDDADLARGIQSLGLLDELLSFYEYSKSVNGDVVLPIVTVAKKHFFTAKNARNPILIKGDPDFVPNDVDLHEQRLLIITGANSGGKTTYCKTIAQMQLLAQIGCYVPAEEAQISIADKILYQAPIFGSILDAEGRFGTELKRTKDIFFKATPRSLIVLDELAEATTYEEKMEISYAILDGFSKIGSTTILVTHNHELANRLHNEGKSSSLQVEFINNKPTYRLISGTAKQSHAELVAEKLGFSSKDMDEHLRRKGYLE